MKTRLTALLGALALLLLLNGCGAASVPAPTGADPAAEAPAEAEAPAPAEPDTPAPENEPTAGEKMAISFTTTVYGGGAVDESVLTGAKLTMLNFFEPWCPPCVAELPELQRLSENYAAEGFQLLGVFATEEGVDAVLENAGVTYPALRYVPAFDRFQTGYVPTTVFLDGAGNQVGETVIGSRSYAEWEEIVKELLG